MSNKKDEAFDKESFEQELLTRVKEPVKVEEEKVVQVDELAELKKQMEQVQKDKDAATVRALAAEKENQEVVRKLAEESNQRIEAQKTSTESLMSAALADSERLEKEMEDAVEKGDFKEYAKLNAKYTQAQIKYEQYSQIKSQEPKEETRVIPKSNISPQTQAWLDRNPRYYTDLSFKHLALEADNRARRFGKVVDSPEYFEFIDNYIEKEIKVDVPKDKIPTALPPSRSQPSATKTVTAQSLSVEEQNTALSIYPRLSPADAYKKYAEGKMAMIQKGRL